MAKRLRPWENEYERQTKTFVSEKQVNGNDPMFMNNVYGNNNNRECVAHSDTDMEDCDRFSLTNSTFSPMRNQFSSSDSFSILNDDEAAMEIELPSTPKVRRKLELVMGEKRAPSPLPNMEEFEFLQKYFSSEKTHGSNNETTPRSSLVQSKKYRQLRLDRLWNSMDNIAPTANDMESEEMLPSTAGAINNNNNNNGIQQ